ncbi:MAG: ATP-binding protein, partial [Magnetococcus sp. YQC-3]
MLELSRVSRDICFFGSKGSGKTLGMTYYGLRAYLSGLNVYSNYHLEFPHKRLQSIDDIMGARDGLVLLDDLEAWLSSRNWKSKENKQVMQIILQGGKRRLTVLFSCKRPENIDVLLRDTTDFWCRCTLIPKSLNGCPDFEEYIKYLDNLLLCIEVFDDSVEPV